MRKLIVQAFVTLDGVMQAPGGPEEDTSGGFEHGGWVAGYWSEGLDRVMGAAMTPPFDLVLGRRTYEIFASYWPHAEGATADLLNGATKHVASRTLTEVEWQHSHLIEGDAAAGVRALKEQDGPDLHIHGSANLIQTFLEHDLVDEFQLRIFPLVLGSGKRLFDHGTMPAGLELVSCESFPTGVTAATYRAGAELKLGLRADEPPE